MFQNFKSKRFSSETVYSYICRIKKKYFKICHIFNNDYNVYYVTCKLKSMVGRGIIQIINKIISNLCESN